MDAKAILNKCSDCFFPVTCEKVMFGGAITGVALFVLGACFAGWGQSSAMIAFGKTALVVGTVVAAGSVLFGPHCCTSPNSITSDD